jgi:hypothetical protein
MTDKDVADALAAPQRVRCLESIPIRPAGCCIT